MTRILSRLAVAGGIATATMLAACSTTPPTRFYALEAVATTPSSPPPRIGKPIPAVGVRVVSLPAAVDRPQFVMRTSDARVSLDEFNRWAGPLRDEIARVVAGDLSAELGGPVVTVSSVLPGASDLLVLLDVQRFDAKHGEGVEVDAVWIIRRPSDEASGRSGRSVVRESASAPGFEPLVAAYNRALASVSKEIAAAIRTF